MTWLQHELKNFGTWMDVKWCIEGGGGWGGGAWMQVRQDTHSKTHIMIPGWVSDWIWMDTRGSFQDPQEGETWPGWRWDTNIETCIEMSSDLNGCETLILHQVSIISTHLHPGDKSPLSKFQNSISVPLSMPSGSLQVLSHIHLGSCLNSIHLSPDFHHGP